MKNQIHNKVKKTQVNRMICYRVTAEANLKNVVLRKNAFKDKSTDLIVINF